MNNTGGNKRDLSACLQPIQKMYAEVEDKMLRAAWDGNDKVIHITRCSKKRKREND